MPAEKRDSDSEGATGTVADSDSEGATRVVADNDSGGATSVVARGGVINILGNVIGVLDPIFMIVVSRLLGAGVLGSYVLAATYVVMLQRLGVIGLDSGLLRHIPMARASENSEDEMASVLGTALRITLILSVVAALGVLLLADFIVAAGGDDAQGDGAWWLAWMIVALPGRAIGQLFLYALRGISKMGAFVLVNNVILPGLLLLIALPAIAFGVGKEALIVAYITSSYIGAVVSYVLFQRSFRTLSLRTMLTASHDRSLVSFSAPQGLTDLLNFLLARVDIVMIAAFFPDEPTLVAVYAIASMLAGVVKKVRQAFDTSLAPVFSGRLVAGDTEALNTLYARVTRWTYALFMLVAGTVSLAAPILLNAFGAEYIEYWLAVPILAAGRWLNAAGGPAHMALLMSGRSRLELLNNMAINVANVGLNLLLISKYGVFGAAIATSISLTLFNAARVVEVRWLMQVEPNWTEVTRVTAAAMVALIPGVSLLLLGFEGRIWITGLAGGLFIAAYPAALYVFGLREDVSAAWHKAREWVAEQRERTVTA